MKRPLFYTGTACFAALAAVFYFGFKVFIPILCCGLIFTLAFYLLTKRNQKLLEMRSAIAAALLGLLLAGGLFWQHNFFRVDVLQNIDGKTVTVNAVVTEVLSGTRSPVYEVYGDIYCDGITYKNYRATFSDYGDNGLKTGQNVEFKAKVKLNDFSTFYGSYNITTGQLLGGYISGKAELQSSGRPLRAAAAIFREKLVKSAYALDEDVTTDLLIALITGDKSGLPDELYRNLGYSGLAHLVAVSGLHLSVILYFLSQILKKTYIPLKIRYVLEIFTAWLVAALTGFNYPVVRAAIMLTVMRLGLILGRSGDTLNSLGFSALVICAFNPYAAGSVSFQATFIATFTIITFSPVLEKNVDKFLQKHCNDNVLYSILNYTLKLMAVGVSAVSGTAIIFYFIYGYVSLNSVISSAVVTPFVPFIMAFGYLAVIINLFAPLATAAKIIYLPAKAMLILLFKAINFFAKLPFIFFVNYDFVYIIAGVFLLVLVLLALKNRRQKVVAKILQKACFAVFAIVFAVGHISAVSFTKNSVKVCVFKEENALLIIDNDSAALIGVPSSSNIERQLRHYGITEIELIILPQDDFVANNTAARFLQSYRPQTVLAPKTVLAESYIATSANLNSQFFDEYQVDFYSTTITVKNGFVAVQTAGGTVLLCEDEPPSLPPEAAIAVVGTGDEELYSQNIYLRRTPFNYFEILLK